MNQELLDIRDLAKADLEMDALKAEAGALAKAVRDLRARDAAQQAQADTLDAALAAARDTELALQRRMKDFQAKATRTQQLMDEGKASDYAAAEKQLSQLLELADQAETQLLEAMEAREEIEAQIATLVHARKQTAVELDAARAHEAERRPSISARYSKLKPIREARMEAVQLHHRSRYNDLRRKEIRPVVDIIDGTCGGCHMEPPPQVANDIANGSTRINNCRGCGAFFFEVRTTEPDEEEEDGEA